MAWKRGLSSFTSLWVFSMFESGTWEREFFSVTPSPTRPFFFCNRFVGYLKKGGVLWPENAWQDDQYRRGLLSSSSRSKTSSAIWLRCRMVEHCFLRKYCFVSWTKRYLGTVAQVCCLRYATGNFYIEQQITLINLHQDRYQLSWSTLGKATGYLLVQTYILLCSFTCCCICRWLSLSKYT